MNDRPLLGDFNSAALWAGLTAFVWYAFGAVPLHIAVSQQLGLSTTQTSSWIFIVWFSGAVSTIVTSLYFRQPIPITWTIPGLIYLGTLGDRFSFAELVGANLVAGLLLLVLGILGVGGRIMNWLPLPIIMGMFGGSILGYVTRMVTATIQDVAVAGAAVGCYLAGRFIANPRVPPVGLAVVGGGVAVALVGTAAADPIEWTLPLLAIPEMAFSFAAVIAVSLPMVVLAMGLGNVQGVGFLLSQGYRVPVNTVSTIVGINSVVNALLGGHPATVARTGVAILASPDSGVISGRYWAAVISASLTVIMALAATPVASLLNVLPKTYIFALAGLAIVSSLQDALEKAFGGKMRFGALAAFTVATTPFVIVGITSAFWAIIVGLLASLLAEPKQLFEFWAEEQNRRNL
ncbi:MAG TPA: benzoate/H(+) symporter BenE family transporter [Candidatus Binatia bacterium]|nr:benzoate/H(+) symporter BenE family transporter [Candidatus Binatia bacterium]